MNPPREREQTYLRVKRRRNETPASAIRLELLGGWNVRRHEGATTSDTANNTNVESNGNSSNAMSSSSNSFPNGRIDGIVVENGGQHSTFPSASVAASAQQPLGGLGNSQHSSISTSTTHTSNVHPPPPQQQQSQPRHANRSAAVWKRVEELHGEYTFAPGEKRFRVVEAILEGDGRSTKRRKLTLLGESNTTTTTGTHAGDHTSTLPNKKRKNNVYRVLDPVTRLVDDSLTMVHAGDRTVAQHYAFVTTDPRVATQSRKWLAYKNRGGNLLHACAHWNDVEFSHDLLRQDLPHLADSVDADGRTPYETAEACGHVAVSEVLEAYGADTTNYVYDMFVPEEYPDQENEFATNMMGTTTMPDGKTANDEPWNPLDKTAISSNTDALNAVPGATAIPTPPNLTPAQHAHDMALLDTSRLLELQGGVGYWTEDGELILEVEPQHMMGITTEYEPDSDVDEDDIDSNCEDYGGNDYPDDDSWEEEFLHEEQVGDDDDSSGSPGADEYNLW